MTEQHAPAKNDNARFAWKLMIIAVAMFVFAVGVMPPLYDVICDITGLNGKTSGTADSGAGAIVQEERLVTVQFLADTDPGMPWDFKPNVRSMKVHPGEIIKVDYNVHNRTSQWLVGQAIPSVAPAQATPHFKKTECFCFNEQELQGGDSMDMPLIFYVDPDLPRSVKTITLSYKLFNITDRVQQKAPQLASNP